MLTKVRYSAKDMMLWTRWETLGFFVYSVILTLLYAYLGFSFLSIPWAPLAVIGTAVAFIVGFQNNAAYGRIWEARKIWGGIVNTSRTWGMKVVDMVSNEHTQYPITDEELFAIKKRLIYRHVAWLTALRHAMRQKKSWEVFEKERANKEWADMIHIPEKITSLKDDLGCYIGKDEMEEVLGKTNKQGALLYLQSHDIKGLKDRGLIWDFSFLELENLLQELFALQGKSERIKNFPYPRQYATLSYYFVKIFIYLLPFATIPEFEKIGKLLANTFPMISPYFVWLAVPFYVVVSWVFYTMERIGRVGENPFEGSANDVPISTIARGIEIDLRELLGETKDQIPGQFPEEHNIQM